MSHFYGLLIRLAYLLPLKRWAVRLQRWLLERKSPRMELDAFDTPEQLELAIRRQFVWRADLAGKVLPFWDWPSEPEVFQARLADVEAVGDGDCDDVHLWAATLLRRMRGVTDVYLLSVGYRNPSGGHTVTVFCRFGKWFLLNYKISLLASPDDAPRKVVHQMRGVDEDPRWYIFETVDFRLVAAGPRGRIA